MTIQSVLSWLRLSTFSPRGYLFDGAPGAVAEPPAAPASTTPPGPGAAGTPPAPTAAGAPGAPAGTPPAGAPKTYTFPEDRTAWTPPHRVRQESSARVAAEGRVTELERSLATLRSQLAISAGITPTDPNAAEVEATKAAFFKMFPVQAQLMEAIEKVGGVDKWMESIASGGEEVNRHHWERHAHGLFDAVGTQVSDALGAELTDRQHERVVSSFKSWVIDQVKADPANRSRYERADPAFVEAFVKEFVEDWFEPVRRSALEGVTRRPRVPSGGPSRPVVRQQPETNFKSPEEAEDAGVNYMKERGHLRQA